MVKNSQSLKAESLRSGLELHCHLGMCFGAAALLHDPTKIRENTEYKTTEYGIANTHQHVNTCTDILYRMSLANTLEEMV